MEGVVVAEIVAGAVSLIGIFIQGFKTNKRDSKNFEDIKDDLKQKHTLDKAKEYHNLTALEIQHNQECTKNDFDTTKETLKESKQKIEGVSYTVRDIEKEVSRVSEKLEDYFQNIMMADLSGDKIAKALSIVELVIQERGELNLEN